MAISKEVLDFLRRLGADQVGHSGKSYVGHLLAVSLMLETWGCGHDVCSAGIFHSIYGTELFRGFVLDTERRGEVAALIGDRAERLAHINGMMARGSFDEAVENASSPYRFRSRLSDERFELGPQDFFDLGRVHLADWLEQVPRTCRWRYRRDAYRRLAESLGGSALLTFQAVYARAGTSNPSSGEE